MNIKQTSYEIAIKQLKLEINFHDPESRTYKAWKRESKALAFFASSPHPHIVDTLFLFKHWNKEHFIFPWAKGGDLLKFMGTRLDTKENQDPKFIMEILAQLIGLAEAIELMHRQKYRHGDLKPENILVFTDSTTVGVWKIADLGLAKFHDRVTGDRSKPTSMNGMGTISYGAPEASTLSNSPRSRLYDIWSMGCIILQLVVFLLYGNNALADLNKKTRTPTAQFQSLYWQERLYNKKKQKSQKTIEVHYAVLECLDKLEHDFESCKSSSASGTSALIDVARLVREKLLVTQVPPNRDKLSSPGYRARAEEVVSELKKIQRQLRHESRSGMSPSTSQPHLQIQHTRQRLSDAERLNDQTGSLEGEPSRQRSTSQAPETHVSQPL